nr:hypothetical protein HUO10_004668 [Paraburkholderia busanensis]
MHAAHRFSRMSLIRTVTAVLLSAVGLGCAIPAFAFDCAKAAKPVEKKICANKSLLSADEQMNAAYSKLLKSAPDAEIREMLVRSQRRWIDARNTGLDGDLQGNSLSVGEVRKQIAERTRLLQDQSDKGLIAIAQRERQWLAKYAGGPFSGFAADCSFIPNDRSGTTVSYTCFGVVHVQNHDRVCSQSQDFASWQTDMYSTVSRVDGGTVHAQAYCDSQSNACNDGSNKAGWVRAAKADGEDRFPVPASGMPRLDAEMWSLVDSAWFNNCLTTPQYPVGL